MKESSPLKALEEPEAQTAGDAVLALRIRWRKRALEIHAVEPDPPRSRSESLS